jgi:hypothetical protein
MRRPYAALATAPTGRSRCNEFEVCRGEACLALFQHARLWLQGDACVALTLRWRPRLRDEIGEMNFEVCRGEACLALFQHARL